MKWIKSYVFGFNRPVLFYGSSLGIRHFKTIKAARQAMAAANLSPESTNKLKIHREEAYTKTGEMYNGVAVYVEE